MLVGGRIAKKICADVVLSSLSVIAAPLRDIAASTRARDPINARTLTARRRLRGGRR